VRVTNPHRMAKMRDLIAVFDAKPLVKRSRFRMGSLDARGVPAILLGVAAIVAARGLSSALYQCATVLPDSLREARALWLTVRAPREMLRNP
jgi:hypothetical protein